MMNIEGHWETVDTLQDVVSVVREYYNSELADKIEEIMGDFDEQEYINRIEELEQIIDQIKELVD